MVLASDEDLCDVDLDIADYVTQTDRNGKATRQRAPHEGSVQKRFKVNNLKKKKKKSLESAEKIEVKKKGSSLVDSIQAICCFGGVPHVTPVDDKTETETVSTDESEQESWLLPPQLPEDVGKKCLVLDLDETLVHSTFKAVPWADFAIPVKVSILLFFRFDA